MILQIAMLIAGGLMLYAGAELLVKGAVGLARAFGMHPLVVGLTVVAYGTSAPELVVSLVAALDHQSALALGNVVGSNIANLGIILGTVALIAPPQAEATLIRREIPVMVAATFLLPALLHDGVVDRLEGGLLFIASIAFTLWTIRTSKRSPDPTLDGQRAKETLAESGAGSRIKLAIFTLAGLAILILGGKVLVDGAVALALSIGMSERIVGLTIVAIGTSLPELAASVIAALRGHSELAIGNVIGSNIFNVLLILGTTSLIHPIQGDLFAMRTDIFALILLSLFAAAIMRTARRITRVEGFLLVAGYGVFVATL